MSTLHLGSVDSTETKNYDTGTDYGGDNLASFVGTHDVIEVKWDGANPRKPPSPPPYSWSLFSGALPPGLILSAAGTIGGTASSKGLFGFSVMVTDNAGVKATQPLAIQIQPGTPGAP